MNQDYLICIDRKLNHIYEDFESNILRVFGRRDVITAIDLVYHSVLSFFFQDDFIQRGYLELLVIGDSGQAKTTLLSGMRGHYELGEVISGETASRTGLVYSIQENQRRRFLQWGAIPLNDRRLLVIDEFSGVATEEIENMSSLRATGIAEVNRSIKSKTAARTRLIFLSNSRDGRMLNEYQCGVEAVDKLFSKKEDIRRLDFAITVASGEVAASEINKRHVSVVKHWYLGRECRSLILWAWSRKPNQIKFTEEAIDKILELAGTISKKFHANIPLVEPADMRIKLARLSAALAARLYSTTNGEDLVVLPEHVQWINNYLIRIYSKNSMAYDLFSQEKYAEARIKDERSVRDLITRHGVDFVKRLLQLKQIGIMDIDVLLNDRDRAKNLLTQLYLANAIKKVRNFYVHTSAFIVLLKRVVQDMEPGIPESVYEPSVSVKSQSVGHVRDVVVDTGHDISKELAPEDYGTYTGVSREPGEDDE